MDSDFEASKAENEILREILEAGKIKYEKTYWCQEKKQKI